MLAQCTGGSGAPLLLLLAAQPIINAPAPGPPSPDVPHAADGADAGHALGDGADAGHAVGEANASGAGADAGASASAGADASAAALAPAVHDEVSRSPLEVYVEVSDNIASSLFTFKFQSLAYDAAVL